MPQKEIKEKAVERWDKEVKQLINEIYNAHEGPRSYRSMENYYVEKIRQLLAQKKQKWGEKVEKELVERILEKLNQRLKK